MNKYGSDYFNLICSGLENAIVTNSNNEVIVMEDALEQWSEQARSIKDYENGLCFFCGNGASASMAEHMSHDWFQNAHINTTTCAEISHVTAISNDMSYEDVYVFRASKILSDKDIFVGISSSGNSPNIVKALYAAKKKGAFCITVTGKKSDNKLRHMGDLNFYVPLENYGEVESAHAVLLHMALDYYLDKYLGGRH